MKYFLAFLALFIFIGLASFLVNFSFKGLPNSLKIDKDSIVKYQEDKIKLCGEDAGMIDYDYNFKLSKVTINQKDDTDQITSERDNFSIRVPSDDNDTTSNLPESTEGGNILTRIIDNDYVLVVISKIDKLCWRIDYKGEVSNDQIETHYGPDFFSQKRLTNRAVTRLIQATYPNEKIRSAGYLTKSSQIHVNNQTYIGAVSRYILDTHTILSIEISTIHKNTLIIYSVTADDTDGQISSSEEAMQALTEMANKTLILK